MNTSEKTLDLSMPFQASVRALNNKKLTTYLKQVNVVLTGYAQSISCTVAQLSIMDVCVDNKHLHPALCDYISTLDRSKKDQCENTSKITHLVKNLPWPTPDEPDLPIADDPPLVDQPLMYDQLPVGLRPVWPFLKRLKGQLPENSFESRTAYLEARSHWPLSRNGTAMLVVLLKVYQENNLQDWITLIEKYREQILKEMDENHPLHGKFYRQNYYGLRATLRAEFKYEFDDRQVVSVPEAQFPPTLQNEIRLFKERARKSSMPDTRIRDLARKKYNLSLDNPRSKLTLRNYVNAISLALGCIPREMYGEDIGVKDFLTLHTRMVEVDEVMETEFYNPLVDYFRQRELNRETNRKRAGYDSAMFRQFLSALEAIAAYNGFLSLRAKFLNAYGYTLDLDRESKEERKKRKKQIYDRQWVEEQIDLLGKRFHQIVRERSFMGKPDGRPSQQSRENLNLCLFYIALLPLRYLGVRQQSVRNCKVGQHIIFIYKKAVHFFWPDTKNKMGIIHRLDMKVHARIQGRLISDFWTFYKEVYPYISGAPASKESAEIKEKRRAAIEGQFFVKISINGLCVPFVDEADFWEWFVRNARKFLDMDERYKKSGLYPGPHFWRGLYGDWLNQDLKLSKKDTADMAGDTEVVFSTDYLEQSKEFDATDTWTKLDQQIEDQERQREQRSNPKAKPGDHEEEKAFMRDLVRKENSRSEKAEAMSASLAAQLADAMARIEELKKQQPEGNKQNNGKLLTAIEGRNTGDSSGTSA